MTIKYLFDGEEIDFSVFEDLVSRRLLSWDDVVALKDKKRVRVNYVGFSINRIEEMLAVFPKNYNIEEEALLLSFAPVFHAVQKVNSDSATNRWGKELSAANPTLIDSNFPFGAFFQILGYYHKYGLHLDEIHIDSRDKGKINWKKTLSKAIFYPVNGSMIPFPIRRESTAQISHLITDAMVYAINHTVDLFGPLVSVSSIPYQTSMQPDIQSYPLIIIGLRQLRAQTFNDRVLKLIDSLIEFFDQSNPGCEYYFKIRNFAYVWQVAVAAFMKEKFERLGESRKPIFSDIEATVARFSNLQIREFNSIRPSQYIDIDHYWFDEVRRVQYVFDAKYFNGVSDLNYKQIFYTLIRTIDPEMQGVSTVSALVLPAREFSSKMHFSLGEEFSKQLKIQNPTLDILEIYLDCKSVICYFQSIE